MNTGCGFDADALVEHAAGRLRGSALERLEKHLAECESCRADLAVVRAVRAAPVEVPDGLEARIRTAVRAARGTPAGASPALVAVPAGGTRGRDRRWSWSTWGVPLAAAAALAAVIAIGRSESGSLEAILDEDYAPYGALPGSDGLLAGDALLSELTVEELERLLEEMEP